MCQVFRGNSLIKNFGTIHARSKGMKHAGDTCVNERIVKSSRKSHTQDEINTKAH